MSLSQSSAVRAAGGERPGDERLALLLALVDALAEADTIPAIADAAIAAIAAHGTVEMAALLRKDPAQGEAYVCAGCLGTDASHAHGTATGPIEAPSLPLRVRGRHLGDIAVRGRPDATDPTQDPVLRLASCLAALALDNAGLSASLADQQGLQGELAMVAELQRDLLARPRPPHFPVYGLNRPIRQVSGDFYDFFERPDGLIPFALGDVSGKGIKAALLMAKSVSLFRCLAKGIDDPAALLHVLNQEICETASRGMFVTMVAGIYDPGRGEVSFANAGHEPPLIRSVDRSYRSYPADAPPLGISADIAFRTEHAALERGELYIFTDGLTEYHYGNQEALGVDGIIQLVESMADQPLRDRLQTLLEALDCDGWEVRDDLTVLAIDDGLAGASR